jgi:hemolysin activation/secretion protein
MSKAYRFLCLACAGVAVAAAPHAAAQVRLDRADPTIVEQALPRPAPPPKDAPKVEVEARSPATGGIAPVTGMIAAVVVEGAAPRDAGSFAPAYTDVIGRELTVADLTALAGRVADIARRNGYPFASASVPPQRVGNGILRVSLDLGKIDAVRVIGARSAAADAILNKALITGQPARRARLEQALLLVGDLPGVRVTNSRFVRQNGFGILLVTIEGDRASAYAQFDNRGSREIGPIRSTILGNVRGLLQSGDELGIVLAQTPIEPSEFVFLRGRYSAPVDAAGSMLSVSASYGRSHPGASLRRLDVIGRSTDVAVTYTRPILRSRARSLWASAEFRAVSIEQTLLDQPLRDDRLATLTGTLNGFAKAGPGVLRGEVSATTGLPLDGVTHEGDARTSRSDGDARFVMLGYTVDWTVQVAKPISIVVASAGQIASRPLLATAEIGLGGPAFARGYDYAERTGDEGIMGSLEVRADAGRVIPGFINRLQLYTFLDGGRVSNLRDGFGGGQLYSTGGGARLGLGPADGMIEVALPLNADRFDTDSKRPRISLRLSKAF